MPAARPLMSPQAEADIHDIATCLKLLVAQSLAGPGIPFDAVMPQLFGEGGYAHMKAFVDRAAPGTGEVRAVA